MEKEGNILVVDDNKSILAALKMLLESTFKEIFVTSTPNTIRRFLQEEQVDVILLDMNFSAGLNTGNEGIFWLREIKTMCPKVQVVLFTAYAEIDLAVRGIKEGAADFVVKPWDNEKLLATLQNAYRMGKNAATNVVKNTTPLDMFWGISQQMQTLKNFVEKVAKTEASILITGENGTGKGLLANEIHKLSLRSKANLVAVDLGSIASSLFESELFGHVKGSFTDARTDRIGKLEESNGSTLFLDEIGNLAFPLQAKLLTAIQQRTITRVGSNTPIPVSFRLICATNQNLHERVLQGTFREDLLYRINTIHLEIPPLRDRTEDIVPLAEIFIRKFTEKYHKSKFVLTEDAKRLLINYSWFGNIRELEHVIEKAIIISDKNMLDADSFQLTEKPTQNIDNKVITLEEMEANMIQKAIDKHEGNLSAVASELGITRQTLYNKMKKIGI